MHLKARLQGLVVALLDAKVEGAGNIPAEAGNGGQLLQVWACGVATKDANNVSKG